MNEQFLNLEEEKRGKILNAAYKEFAEHGYKEASTNRIVKGAGIGKGMLFYYFNSKKELFEDLINHGVAFICKEYLERIDEKETDLIEKYRVLSRLKYQAYSKNPHIFHFFGTYYWNNREEEISDGVVEKMKYLREQIFERIFKKVDVSLFREDIAPEMVHKMIQWTMAGYEAELTKHLRTRFHEIDLTPYWEDFEKYLDALKKVYYR